MEAPLKAAILALLKPLIRYLIGQGWTYPALSELLKVVYVAEAERHYATTPQQPATDSRISLLTGIHRKDVKRIRQELAQSGEAPALRKGANLAARLVAAWVSDPKYQDPQGKPQALPFRDENGKASFESLVRELKADLRAKSVLDELMRVGVASQDADGRVSLLRTGYISSLPEDKLAFLGANVGDHLESALHNIAGAQAPYIERAVFYDAVPAEELAALRPALFQLGDRLLREVNRLVMPLDREKEPEDPMQPRKRMRFGVYYYEENKGEQGT